MKKIHLTEWGIITIALIFGYKFFENLFSLVIQVVYGFEMYDLFGSIVKIIFVSVVYAVVFVLLFRNSFKIATLLCGQSASETLSLTIGKRALTHVIILGICFYSILSNASTVIFYIFDYFKREVGGNLRYGDDRAINKFQFQIAVSQVIVALVVIYFSKNIINWFIRKSELDELVFDSKPGDKNDVQQ